MSRTAVLFLRRQLLKIAKSPDLSTGVNDNTKSRYGNDLKFVMTLFRQVALCSSEWTIDKKNGKKIYNHYTEMHS